MRGAAGLPNGVSLSHANIVCNVLVASINSSINSRDENTNVYSNKPISYDEIAKMVDKIRHTIDIYGDGTINRKEIEQVFTGSIQRGGDLLR